MAHRVRTGCKTCRKRRIKCDETKPSCKRCTNANFVCEGFVEPKNVSLVIARPVPPQTNYSCTLENSNSELSWRHNGWQREQLPIYHHFVTTTATRLFRADHVGFWRDQVAQLSFGVDVVYEALLAIGAVHRATLLTRQLGSSQEAAKFRVLGFNSYGRALKLIPQLITRDDPADRLALLVTLILLTYFECFVESSRGAFRHLWAAIQLLRRIQGTTSNDETSDLAPVYDVMLRLDFLAQKIIPYAGSSFLRCADHALMETPFWNRPAVTFSGSKHLDQIAAERYRLMQLVGSHNMLSRVLWGCWCPIDERPSRDELMGFYEEIRLWKANSPATFASCSWDDDNKKATDFATMAALPIPPSALFFGSTEAAITVAMHNAYLGCALAMISATDEDSTSHELDAFNLVYENMRIASGLIGTPGGGYRPCDTLGTGISLFLYMGARRSYSSSWQQWTLETLRSIGREGLFSGTTSGNTLQIMWELEARIRSNVTHLETTRKMESPLGSIKDRLNTILLPLGDDGHLLAYFIRYGDASHNGDERIVQIVAKARWREHEDGTAHSLELDVFDKSAGGLNPNTTPAALEIFSPWRDAVEMGWHGYLTA